MSRRLLFDSSDEEYESCDSDTSLNSPTNRQNSQFNESMNTLCNESFKNTSQQPSTIRPPYSIHEMMNDLMDPDAQVDFIQTESLEFETETNSNNDIHPQRIDDFRSIEEEDKLDICFIEDAATKTISNAMISEYDMISNKVKQELRTKDDTEPDINELVEYFFWFSFKLIYIFNHVLLGS